MSTRRAIALEVDRATVVKLWLERQGLTRPRARRLTRATFVDHLESCGALQLDSVNAVERAHYLTLWSRFGAYQRQTVDRWIYEDRLAYEYWGHEASLLPRSHLPLGRRRMRRFPPPSWAASSWWQQFDTPLASRRRVLRRLRHEGPLESADFARRADEKPMGDGAWLPKEDKRSLKMLWHTGRIAIRDRRHFRCVYDLAERVLPASPVASTRDYHDSWLLAGLRGNGIASSRHLTHYFTAPNLNAAERRRIIARNLAAKRIVRVRVSDLAGEFFALPEHLDRLEQLPEPEGTGFICPFDSLLWQRQRAADLLDFDYKIEIYVPAAKRRYGYYVLPILHDGRLVGRLDPKLHREQQRLEIRSLHLESGFTGGARFERGLEATLESLATFLGAKILDRPA